MNTAVSSFKSSQHNTLGLFVGALAFLLVLSLPTPDGMTISAQRTAAVATLMSIWWLSDALPFGATALLPLVLFPALSILDIRQFAFHYADPNIFLYLGGFMIALSMERWNLHRRLALNIMCFIGGGPRRMLGGFMLSTFFLSMWISNTATTLMMVPIALAVVGEVREGREQFGLIAMLGIAYAASIGGTATPIGTPPTLIFLSQVQTLVPSAQEIAFVDWMRFGLPTALGFAVITWFYLAYGVGSDLHSQSFQSNHLKTKLEELGPVKGAEWLVGSVALFTAIAWITRKELSFGILSIPGWSLILPGVGDASVAIFSGITLFSLPSLSSKGERLLDWPTTKKLPWEVLLLIGGGVALAEGMKQSELTTWLAGGFTYLEGFPQITTLFSVCLFSTLLTELFSNSPAIAMALPILAASGDTLGVPPLLLMIASTLSVSYAFMIPVGTPPNAIVFASGYIRMAQMARVGFVLSIAGAFWTTLCCWIFVRPLI